jgi:hypothetical protein
MEYLVVCTVALVVSGLTLFSGFGLGTVLMPALALFFPVPVAIAATAVIHLANNLFKVFLVGRMADWGVVARFAIPGAGAAFIGAALLNLVAHQPPLGSYSLFGHPLEVTAVKLVIGLLIVGFSLFELAPSLRSLSFNRRWLPLGGFISGFFGGLSGNQGALRSAFLIKSGLAKEAFVGTGTVSAVIVDAARLAVYGMGFYATRFAEMEGMGPLVLAATAAAFLGSFLGARLLKKITYATIQLIVGVLLVVIGLGMAAGLL